MENRRWESGLRFVGGPAQARDSWTGDSHRRCHSLPTGRLLINSGAQLYHRWTKVASRINWWHGGKGRSGFDLWRLGGRGSSFCYSEALRRVLVSVSSPMRSPAGAVCLSVVLVPRLGLGLGAVKTVSPRGRYRPKLVPKEQFFHEPPSCVRMSCRTGLCHVYPA